MAFKDITTSQALADYKALQNSELYDIIETKGFEEDTRIFASVNGIFISLEKAKLGAEHLSKTLKGRKIHHFYNRSSGASDIIEAAEQRVFGKETLEKSYNLAIFLMKLIDAKGLRENKGTLVLIAHSQGGLITKDAEKYLSEEYRPRIQVVAMGSPINLDNQYNRTPVQFGASNDPVFRLSKSSDSVTVLPSENSLNPKKAHSMKRGTLTDALSLFDSQDTMRQEKKVKEYLDSFVYQFSKLQKIDPEKNTSEITKLMIDNSKKTVERFKDSDSYRKEKLGSPIRIELDQQLDSLQQQLVFLEKFARIFDSTEASRIANPDNKERVIAKFLMEYNVLTYDTSQDK